MMTQLLTIYKEEFQFSIKKKKIARSLLNAKGNILKKINIWSFLSYWDSSSVFIFKKKKFSDIVSK